MTPRKTPARRVEYVPLDDIVGADSNPKRHDTVLLEDSIARFGFTEPIVIDERTGKLVAGHGRVDQLRALFDRGDAAPEGIEGTAQGGWSVPVIRGWSSKDDKEAAAYLLASNRITERGGWDRLALAEALTSLEGDLAGVGFDQGDLDDLLARLQESQDIAHENHRGDEGSWDDTSYDEFRDPYSEKGARSIVLDYPLETFERVVELAGKARAATNVESNSDLFLALLEKECGE